MIRFHIPYITVLVVVIVFFAVTSELSMGQSSNVINGCVGTLTGGALRIVSSPDQCKPNLEVAVSWNKTGPQGAQGSQGSQGPQGAQGPEGLPGKSGGICNKECSADRRTLQLYYLEVNLIGEQSCPDELAVELSCGPYDCDPDIDNCITQCDSDGECTIGYVCAGGRCTPNVYRCLGGFGDDLTNPKGDVISCAPYRCSGTVCLSICQSTAECVQGYVCSVNGTCVPPDTGG